MANSTDNNGSNPSNSFLKHLILDKILPGLNLTTYHRLKAFQSALNTAHSAIEKNVADLTDLNTRLSGLAQTNIELENLKFQVTGKWIAQYAKSNPRPTATPRREISASPEERAQQVRELLKSETLPLDVLAVLAAIPETYDNVYRHKLRPLYEERLVGERPDFWDVRMSLSVLGRVLQPRTYLEIGTRVGWSLSQLLAYSPHTEVYSFDMWIEHYAGMDNPGADFVRNMMGRVTTPVNPQIHFLYGNSHDTLPQFFHADRYPSDLQIPASKPAAFDLITVDGDHSLEGAWMDLTAVMPHIGVGGAIVFDDIDLSLTNSDIGVHSETRYPDFYKPMPEGLQSLRDVWNAVKKLYPNFIYIDGGDEPLAVGIGIRVS